MRFQGSQSIVWLRKSVSSRDFSSDAAFRQSSRDRKCFELMAFWKIRTIETNCVYDRACSRGPPAAVFASENLTPPRPSLPRWQTHHVGPRRGVSADGPFVRARAGTRHLRTWANRTYTDRASKGLSLFVERTISPKTSTSATACPNAILVDFIYVFVGTLPVHWINAINAIAPILFYCV